MAQTVVNTFDGAGSAVAFVAEPMLPDREEVGIDFVAIGVNEPPAVSGRDFSPEFLKPLCSAVTDYGSKNLTAVARNGYPEPEIALLADTEFINLHRIEGKVKQVLLKRRRLFF